MAKEEWGTKRVCPTTGKRFYDLNRDPIVSPYTGEVVTVDTGNKSRTLLSDKSEVKPETASEEDDAVVLEDDDDTPDVDLGDEVLDEDEEDTVALDDIADVSADDDDS